MKPQPLFAGLALMLSFCRVGLWADHAAVWAQERRCAGDCNQNNQVTIDEVLTGVDIALNALPVDRCRAFDLSGDDSVTVDELLAAVRSALEGCDAQANRAPHASEVSFGADTATPYVEKQLIGSDPDNDTITYELIADETGPGYSFAYVNPDSGVLYVTLLPGFQGSIVLPYRVTDGQLFSNTANAALVVQAVTPSRKGGLEPIDPAEYASHPRGFYNGAVLGAPGSNPTLPSWVDLSADYPLPGDQGQQNSCVGWSLGYAIRTYQERVENGWSLEPVEHRFSPSYIYNQLNGGEDLGIPYKDGLNLLVDQGVATLARMPYNSRDFVTQPSAAARQEASQFKAKSWKPVNGVLEVKSALANHLSVFMVIQLLDDIYGLSGPDSVYNTFGGAWQTGHGVAAVGYDDNRYGGAFKIINSWGQNWGDGGYFWMPYTATNSIVATPYGQMPVLTGAVVIEDLPDPEAPDPDPVDPPPAGDLPDLQVTDWRANFDGRPGASGALQYTVTNTGVGTAPAGAYVALLLSRSPTFTASNTLVVYERIPFDMPPGTTAYRDANNTIAFNFPDDLEPGQYFMAVWADVWNNVDESNENDNVSPATTMVDIVNTLPDMQVVTWYSTWDELGAGWLTYEVANNGASTAPAGWLITLALSPNDIIGDGDETFLFSEPASFDVDPGGTLYRDDSAAARFSLYFDHFGNPVPDGVYYIALWLDPNDFLTESNEINNASLSWGTIPIGVGRGVGSDASAATSVMVPSEAYNGKTLPARQASVRRGRISSTPEGGRRMEFLNESAVADARPRVKAAESHRWSKLARARQQVIFPVTEMKPMPDGN